MSVGTAAAYCLSLPFSFMFFPASGQTAIWPPPTSTYLPILAFLISTPKKFSSLTSKSFQALPFVTGHQARITDLWFKHTDSEPSAPHWHRNRMMDLYFREKANRMFLTGGITAFLTKRSIPDSFSTDNKKGGLNNPFPFRPPRTSS